MHKFSTLIWGWEVFLFCFYVNEVSENSENCVIHVDFNDNS